MTKKNRDILISEFSNLVFFWFFGVIYFLIFRISFIGLNSSDINPQTEILEFLKVIYMGFRFDITVISYFIVIPLLLNYLLVFLDKMNLVIKTRIFFQKLFIYSTILIIITTLNFYKEYKDQFNHFLFMGLYDDKKAVFQTILKDYEPIKNAILIFVLIFISLKFLSFYEKKSRIYKFINSYEFKYKELKISVLVLILFVFSIRGSFTEYPVRRFYASISSDDFLNKTIINPFRSLNNAVSDYNDINKNFGENPFGEILSKISTKSKTIKKLLEKKTTSNSLEVKPKQIFLVVMESYDSWPLTEKYKDLNISNNLKSIGNKGISFMNFLPASYSTMNSFASIVTNIPYSGVNMSIIGANKSYPSSIFKQFKALGYQTNFFYGGYLSWQNIKNFTKKQGVENVFGAGNISDSHGIWGVNDESLFEKVLAKVDDQKNSLNIILTTSFHSPYEIDVFSKGFPYSSKEELPDKIKKNYDEGNLSIKALGHLWYADMAIGKFVKKAEKKYPNALFAFTGDHFGRKFINGSPTLYESSSVPFILYGKSIDEKSETNCNPGSHIDIAPTLIELVAPSNFTYYSFGNSLLNNNRKNKLGIGYNKVINSNQISEFSKNYGIKKQSINSCIQKNDLLFEENKREHDSLMSLAWHYVTNGDRLD